MVFQGATGIGKTVALQYLIDELLDVLHIQLHRVLYVDIKQNINFNDIIGIVENNSPYKTYLFIDNIDYMSDYSVIEKLLTKYASLVKIVITTTKDIHFLDGIINTKIRFIDIFPLSFLEFLQAKRNGQQFTKVNYEKLKEINKDEKIPHLLEEYILYGGYPSVVSEADVMQKPKLLNYIISSIYKDDIFRLEDISKYLSLHTGELLNLCDLAVFLDLSRYKSEKNLAILEELKLISFLPSFETKIKKALVKSYKIFFHDTGFRNSIIGLFHSLNNRNDKINLYQNFIALQLYNALNGEYMSFFRTTNQTEINFIIEKKDSIIPVQLVGFKAQNNIPRIFKTFIKNSNRKISKMIVITKDVMKKEKIDNIIVYFIPIHLISFWNI